LKLDLSNDRPKPSFVRYFTFTQTETFNELGWATENMDMACELGSTALNDKKMTKRAKLN